MDVRIEPKEALTGFLNLLGIEGIRLDFLITFESDAYYIRCLDFGVMSCGETITECKENIKEAILIYLEDLPERQNLFKPAPPKYWQMFYELRYQSEQKQGKAFSGKERRAIEEIGNVINPLIFILTNKTENARGDTRTNEEEETRMRGYNREKGGRDGTVYSNRVSLL